MPPPKTEVAILRLEGEKLPVTASLPRDLGVDLAWDIKNVSSGSAVQRQSVQVLIGKHLAFSLDIPAGQTATTFRMPAGAMMTTLTATITVWIAGSSDPATSTGTLSLAAQPGYPERESVTAAYSEHQQEMRRMRTLYETYLIVVTGGFGILVSQAGPIVGKLSARYHFWLDLGVAMLSFLICYLVTRIAERYARTDSWVKNFERALGLRDYPAPEPLMPETATPWYKSWNHHVFWAFGLITYTAMLAAFSIALISSARAPVESNAEKHAAPTAPAESSPAEPKPPPAQRSNSAQPAKARGHRHPPSKSRSPSNSDVR
jgi:hypothetical protein